jgi:twinkle protein
MATIEGGRMAQDNRPSSLADGLAEHGIPRGRRPLGLPTLEPGTYTLACPKCADRRRGRKTPSLHLKIDPDGMGAVWSCFNAGDCIWNTPQGFRVAGAGSRDHTAHHRREYTPPPEHERDPDARIFEWFAQRGISEATVRACGVKAARVWMPQTQREDEVIAFPFRREGKAVNWKYRGPNKIFRQEKGAEKILFGLDDIRGQATVIIVEGEPDKLALWEAGIRHVASVPDGAPEVVKDGDPDPRDPKFDYLWNCEAELKPAEEGGPAKIILAVDNDKPGRALEYELARRLGLDRCWRVRWPDGCKDANDVLRQHGAEELHRCLDQASPWPIKGVVSAMDMREDVLALYADGLPPGAPLGWDATDTPEGIVGEPIVSLPTSMMVVLTGAPNAGKSNWWDAVMVNRAKGGRDHKGQPIEPWTWAVLSFETPVVRHIAGLAAKVLRKPFREGPTERMTVDELENAIAWVHERFHFLHADDEAPTVAWIVRTLKTLIVRHGIKGFVIDPYTEIVKDRSNGARDTDLAEEFLTAVRSLCRVHDVLGCVIAHPAKPGKDAPRVPGMYDISGSAHWNNKADIGLSIWRDREDPAAPVEVHVKKIRFSEHGQSGTVARLDYVPAYQGYRDVRERLAYEGR